MNDCGITYEQIVNNKKSTENYLTNRKIYIII